MTEHTKLPWKFSRKFRYVSDINHNVIAEIAPLHAFEANAAFIVKAVNNHQEALEIIEALLGLELGSGERAMAFLDRVGGEKL